MTNARTAQNKYNYLFTFAFFFAALLIMQTATIAEEALYISFDHDTNGTNASGDITPSTITGNPVLAPGKSGHALVSGPTYGWLNYPTKNILNPTEGTVAMWVKPVNWDSNERAFHVFFQALGQNGLVLYKYFENENLLMLATRNMSTGPFFTSGLSLDWKAGKWHHLAGTWSSDGILLFIDGEPVAKAPAYANLPQSIDKEFLIGDAAWSTPRSSYSLIDEVRIFTTALPPKTIKNIFLGKDITDMPTPPTAIAINGNRAQIPGLILQEQPKTITASPESTVTPTPISVGIPTEIQLTGKTVSTAVHQLQFTQGALPAQISVAGKSFLNSPITLVISQNNQRIVMAATNNTVEQQGASDVVTAQSQLIAGQTALQIKSTIERDGLITIELSSINGQSIPQDAELTVEIPLNASVFDYRIRWQNNNRDLVETLKSSINIDSTAFVPYYWLGNNESGLFWFSDTSRNWPNALVDDAIRIDRVGSNLLFRQKLKGKGQVIPADWKYRFGLQLTPVKKPTPSAWRKLRLAPAVGANTEIIWPTPTTDSLKYYGYPEAADPARFAKRVSTLKGSNRAVISYMTPSFVSTGAPEWSSHQNLWMSGIFDSTSSDVRAMGGSLAGVTPTSESWKNFISNKATSFQKIYDLDGFYFDNAQVYGLYNPQLNLGYSAHGAIQKDYPIFEYRELFKRIIESLRTDNPSSQIIIHSSGHLALPIVSLADTYIDGEQYRGVVKNNYLDVLGLDQLRAEFMGRQWGLIPIFLPEFDASNAAKIEPTRGLMGLLMLHDIGIWPLWCNVSEVNRALSALDRFNFQQSEFLPYFSAHPPALSSSPNILVSSYKNSNTDQLLAVINVSKTNASGETCLSQSGAYQFTNWLTGKILSNTKPNCFNLSVGTQDYALIHVATASQ